MCNFGGKQSAAESTTPTYVPPAQTQTTATVAGTAAQPAPGVQVKGNRESRYNGTGQVTNFRRAGGSGGQVDDPTITKKRRSASASLGL